MKYNLQINQKIIVESGLKLDIIDACLLDYIQAHFHHPGIEKKYLANKVFACYDYADISDALPLLKLKKDSIYRRVKKMVDKKLLEQHPSNQIVGKSFLHISQIVFEVFDPKNFVV